ncbi:hypothetical protein KIW84_031141 [Lathyrus oleraceus]|uniref:Arabidopsis retrotransposon Orf1 C-terminal domain-containing protein n=1 Tax=Pisum sativum TaxID=3888 RepID=A0A9D4XRM8_PEA|nr:hypothetical protein KIW84_031141 [Pisum sativum]
MPTRYAHETALRDLGLYNSVRWMLGNLRMSDFCAMTSPTYVRITYKFLSSFYYSTQPSATRISGWAYEGPLESDWALHAFRFWQRLSGETTTDWECLKSTCIHNIVIHDLHLILAYTFFGRENNGKVNSKELYFMHYALAPSRVNPTPFMLVLMQFVAHRTTCVICIGGLVTSLALAMNLYAELATLVPFSTPFLDKDACHNMRMISNRQGGR